MSYFFGMAKASLSEALEAATAYQRRAEYRAKLVEALKEDDMVGLECSNTVELERLEAEDLKACELLASYVLAEYGDGDESH